MLADEDHWIGRVGCCLKCCMILNQAPSCSPPPQKTLYNYYQSKLIHWFNWYQILAWFQATESWKEKRYSSKGRKQMSQSCIQKPIIYLVLKNRGQCQEEQFCMETVSTNKGNKWFWGSLCWIAFTPAGALLPSMDRTYNSIIFLWWKVLWNSYKLRLTVLPSACIFSIIMFLWSRN